MPFRDYMQKIAPPWLKGTWAGRWLAEVGGLFDWLRSRASDATMARFPDYSATDALEKIGEDRQLERGAGPETDAAYRARVKGAWTIWGGDDTAITGKGGGAGSHLGLLNALKTAGFPTGATGATIVQQNGLYSQLDGSGNLVTGNLMDCVNRVNLAGALTSPDGWTFEGRDLFYSEFGIVFPVDVPALRTGTQEAARLNAIVDRWRPANMLYIGCWLIEAGRLLGWPAGSRTCGTEPNLGGNVRHFVPGARAENTLIGYAP